MAGTDSATFMVIITMCEDYEKKYVEFPTTVSALRKFSPDIVYGFQT